MGETRHIASTCQGCVSNCPIMVEVADGAIVGVTGNPASAATGGVVCPGVRIACEQQADPDRVLFPLRRANPRKGRHERPEFVRVTWDEALDEIASRLMALRLRGEGHRVAVAKGRSTEIAGLLMDALPSIYGTPNRFDHDSLCSQAESVGLGCVDGVWTNHEVDIARSRYVLLWGTDPLSSNRQKANALRCWKDLRSRAHVVCIDPRLSYTAQRSDEWLAVTPGTDAALACAFAHVILVEGVWDRGFVGDFEEVPNPQTRVFSGACGRAGEEVDEGLSRGDCKSGKGFQARPVPQGADLMGGGGRGGAAFVAGEEVDEGLFQCNRVHGLVKWWNLVLKDATPEWAADICGIDAGTIRRVAREFAAAGPQAVSWTSQGVGMTPHGVHATMAAHALNGLVGSVGVAGGVFPFASAPLGSLPPCEDFIDDVARAANAQPPCDFRGDVGQLAGKAGRIHANGATCSLVDAILEGRPYQLDTLIAYWMNWAFSAPEPRRWWEALSRLPFFVHVTTHLSETSMFADIVLPARHHAFETWGLALSRQNAHATVTLEQPCVPAPGEARNDEAAVAFGLASKLAERSFPNLRDYYLGVVDPETGEQPADGEQLARNAVKTLTRPLWESVGGWDSFRRQGVWNSEPAHPCEPGESASFAEAAKAGESGKPSKPSDLRNPGEAGARRGLDGAIESGELGGTGDSHELCEPGDRDEAMSFATPSGKFEFESLALRDMLIAYAARHSLTLDDALATLDVSARGDCAWLPHYEPVVAAGDPGVFPFVFTQHRSRASLEGRAANSPLYQELKASDPGEEPWADFLKMHPRDLESLGLQDGDEVVVESPRASLRTTVRGWEGTRPGVVVKCYGQGHWAYGHVAALDFEAGIARGANNNDIVPAVWERISSSTARYGGFIRVHIRKALDSDA